MVLISQGWDEYVTGLKQPLAYINSNSNIQAIIIITRCLQCKCICQGVACQNHHVSYWESHLSSVYLALLSVSRVKNQHGNLPSPLPSVVSHWNKPFHTNYKFNRLHFLPFRPGNPERKANEYNSGRGILNKRIAYANFCLLNGFT